VQINLIGTFLCDKAAAALMQFLRGERAQQRTSLGLCAPGPRSCQLVPASHPC
jgi:hypothetical protein